MILLDTNVISEGMRPIPDANVHRWLNAQPAHELFLCTPVLAELRYGIELLPPGARRKHFEQVIRRVEESFGDRVLSVDRMAAHEYGRIMAEQDRLGRATGTMDGLIAAIARIHRASVATRDTRGFDELGIDVIDPFELPKD